PQKRRMRRRENRISLQSAKRSDPFGVIIYEFGCQSTDDTFHRRLSKKQSKRAGRAYTSDGRTIRMRNPVIIFLAVLVWAMTILPQTAAAQTAQRGGAGRGNAASPGAPHDPHDLTGIWLQRGGGTNSNPIS